MAGRLQACNAGTSCQSSKEKARRNPHEVDAGQERGKQDAALELRLLRYFVAVAEELHFARAAERLGVEQSPVSRAMRNLEATLGVQLFDRSAHQTRLTWAGQVFLGECRRVLATVEQAVSAAKAAAQGYQGYLRIAICDSLAQPQIATLLARSREPWPTTDGRAFLCAHTPGSDSDAGKLYASTGARIRVRCSCSFDPSQTGISRN